MTPDQILLVQTTFELVGADGGALAGRVRERLAARDLAPVAPPAGLLVLAVRGLSRARTLRAALRRLGARRRGTGLHDAQLAAIGQALVESVEELLGAALPRAVRDACHACVRMEGALVREGAAAAAA